MADEANGLKEPVPGAQDMDQTPMEVIACSWILLLDFSTVPILCLVLNYTLSLASCLLSFTLPITSYLLPLLPDTPSLPPAP